MRIKYNQTCFAFVLIFNAWHCICFIKLALEIFKTRKFGMGVVWG